MLTSRLCLTLLALQAASPVTAQSLTKFTTGGRDIVRVDIAGTAVGDFPVGIEMIDGIMEVVDFDGRRMLRASSRSTFLVRLPQLLPQDFTLEFEIVPKAGGNPEDLAVEGTPQINQGAGSANVMWHRDYLQIVGGGATYDSKVPESFAAGLPGVLTHIAIAMQGPMMKLYTNGRLMFTQQRQFVRGRVLRIFLGGQDDGPNAVYLASMRVVDAVGAITEVASNQSSLTGGSLAGSLSGGQPTSTASSQPAPGTPVGVPPTVTAPAAAGATGAPRTGASPSTPGQAAATQQPSALSPASNPLTTVPPSGTNSTPNPSTGTGAPIYVAPPPPPNSGTGMLSSAALPPNAGRYRVTITGFAAVKPTIDDIRAYDGARDEVYAVGAVILWDRKLNGVITRSVIRSREYGDIANGEFGSRIKAGSATGTGGIWGGGGSAEYIPATYDPRSATPPAPIIDQFPLLVWEGVLTDGVEGLLIAPSLWESDLKPLAFDNYQANWQTAPPLILSKAEVQSELTSTTFRSFMFPRDAGKLIANSLVTLFTGGLVGQYGISSVLLSSNIDRPIGLAPGGNATDYQDRLVVLSREKLSGLAPGAGITMPIVLAEPADGLLDGMYTLYLRVERVQ